MGRSFVKPPDPTMERSFDVETRFWAKVKKTEHGCWLWLPPLAVNGYGQFWVNGRMVGAHRYSYELTYGPIPKHDSYHGMCVLHRCDVRGCVRPDHLFLGTNADNSQDKVSKNRHAKGETNGSAKLTKPQVIEIRSQVLAGRTQSEIAQRFGVHQSVVSVIASRKTWKHV